jgi:hypothetical protein
MVPETASNWLKASSMVGRMGGTSAGTMAGGTGLASSSRGVDVAAPRSTRAGR